MITVYVILIITSSCSQRLYDPVYKEYKVYKNLERALRNVDDVYVLDLSSTNLDEFPMEILTLKNLKVLFLYNNNIKRLPDEIDKLDQLEFLNAMENELDNLPASIQNIKTLKKLYVAKNNIYHEDVKQLILEMPDCQIIYFIMQ